VGDLADSVCGIPLVGRGNGALIGYGGGAIIEVDEASRPCFLALTISGVVSLFATIEAFEGWLLVSIGA
jgi:hypothetical protein